MTEESNLTEKSLPERFFGAFFDYLFGEKAIRTYKMENGLNFYATDYAFVPDETKPATWKIRLAEQPGKISKSRLDTAVNELVGNQSELPPDTVTAVKRRLRAEYTKLGVHDSEIPISIKASFSLEKSGDTYRWQAIYTNNLRDDDYPSEIISGLSHERFAILVKAGIVPPPELWIWHIPGTRIGAADYVDTVKEGEVVFSIATGTIDPGMEDKARRLCEIPDIAMSHGMPIAFIQRDPRDPSVITHHITREISVLPRWAAANKSTKFLIKEHTMPLSPEQKKLMGDLGFDESRISDLDKDIAQEALRGEGREIKEGDTPPADAAPPADNAMTTDVAGDLSTTGELRKEIADTLGELFSPIAMALKSQNELIKSQNDRLASLESAVAELKVEDSQKVASLATLTPSLSLKQLVAQSIIGEDNEAQLDGRSKLARDKPKQAPGPSVTGVPFLDTLMAGMAEEK